MDDTLTTLEPRVSVQSISGFRRVNRAETELSVAGSQERERARASQAQGEAWPRQGPGGEPSADPGSECQEHARVQGRLFRLLTRSTLAPLRAP